MVFNTTGLNNLLSQWPRRYIGGRNNLKKKIASSLTRNDTYCSRIITFLSCLSVFLFITGISADISAQTDNAPDGNNTQDSAFLRPNVEFDANGLRDPFKDYLPAEEITAQEKVIPEQEQTVFQPPALTIQGIIWGGKTACAIINGEVKKEGEDIQGVKICEIKKEGVELLYQGRKYTLSPVLTVPKKKIKSQAGGNDERLF